MRISYLFIVSAAMVLSSSAFAQRFEAYGDYSYLHFNPTVTGFQSRSFNGGGAGAGINFAKFFAIKGDFQGYGSTDVTFTTQAPIVNPQGGTLPAGSKITTKANMFTYLFGPEVHVQTSKFKVFGEVLLGGSNTSGYTNLYSAAGFAHNPSQHPFTMAIGGGLDLKANKHLGFRLGEFDYILTRFTNVFTNSNNQNSFRYLGGVVVYFGGD
jgi:hypothetical protein